MLYGVIRTFSMNLGDEIQTIAAMRFLPRVDAWIDRERMPDSAVNPEVFVIANGWFMHRPERFPPPANIHPFYISIHIHDATMLSQDAVSHFRRWEPIGCRDEHTLTLLRARGVAAYFSGCLTWTLPRPDVVRRDNILVVDVPARIRRRMPDEMRRRAVVHTHSRLRGMSSDYHPLPATLIPWSLREFWEDVRATGLPAATWHRRGRVCRPAHEISEHRRRLASDLLGCYARAELVITSRIHCLFPCMAFHTPAIFVHADNVFAPQRFTINESFMQRATLKDLQKGGWQPQPCPDISRPRRFLELLCAKAVAMQDNPLRHEPIEAFYQASGWHGSGVSRGS